MKKRGKMNATRAVILVIMILLLLFSGLFGWILMDEYVIPEKKIKARLDVEEVYFVENYVSQGKTRLEVFVFITNDGDTDCDSFIRAFAIDKDTNIAMDDTTTSIVEIKGQTSHESQLGLNIPSDGRYRVELLIFKNGKITVKGQGFVDLNVGGSGGSDYRTSVSDPESIDDNEKDVPFIGPGLMVIAILGAALVFRRWRK